MKFRQGIVTVLLVVMLASTNVFAKELTLDDCLTLALQNRRSIIAARGQADLARAGKRAALGAFLPSISASYSYSKGKETDIDPMNAMATGYTTTLDTTTINGQTAIDAVSTATGYEFSDEQDLGPSKSLSISGQMWLLNLGNWFSLAEASSRLKASQLDVINSEQDLIYAVKLAFYAYLATAENVDVQKDAVERSNEQLKLIESKYDLGSASLSDVLKQKVQNGNDKLSLLKAENSVVTSKASLAYTIGLNPNDDNINFSSNYQPKAYDGSMQDAIKFGIENEPGYLSSQSTVSAAGKSLKAGYMGYLPRLSGSASWTKFNGTQAYPTTFDYSSKTMRYGFTISWNIFDGFLREQTISSKKVALNNARAAEAENRNLLARDIKSSFFEIQQQKQSKQIAQDNVDAANEDLKITQEKYNLGAATILDLLSAQVSLKQAQVSLIQAGFDLNLAIAKLENAMGKQ